MKGFISSPSALLPAIALVLTACGSGGRGADVAASRDAPAQNPEPREELTGCAANAANFAQLVSSGDALTTGAFSNPFCEEKALSDAPDEDIPDRGTGTLGTLSPIQLQYNNLENCERRDEDKFYECKPAAGSISLLPDNRLVYFNALESLENGEFNIFKEGGDITVNDQTRVLSMGADGQARWSRPEIVDGGASNPNIQPGAGTQLPLLGNINPGVTPDDEADNDGALFCADLINLYDGRVMAAGGTDYYTELLLVELEGIKNTRIFNPQNDTWTESDPMSWGRWYPTMVSLINGNVFIASGVRKLIKPVYLDRPQDSLRNETHTEIFQPGCDDGVGRWFDNGASGQKSLPLYPRLHLLPNNTVFYNAAGQVFNPLGQSIDEAFWNLFSYYDPQANSWTNLGIPGSTFPGFRGSASSIMMPLRPNAQGQYDEVRFLTPGGIFGVSPGTYVGLSNTRLDVVSLSPGGGVDIAESRNTGQLNAGRWYGQGVLLPDGKVFLVSGGAFDEVVNPGVGAPLTMTEMYDPQTETWTQMVEQSKARTYHNSALLLPDATVLVGGHSPISLGYALNADLPILGTPQGRDPSFEIYHPPYIFMQRPEIQSLDRAAAAPGERVTIRTADAQAVAQGGYVALVRRTAMTHLVDGDQRTVIVPIVESSTGSITIQLPSNDPGQLQAVLPPGHYMTFIVTDNGGTRVPSVSAPLQVTGADLSCR